MTGVTFSRAGVLTADGETLAHQPPSRCVVELHPVAVIGRMDDPVVRVQDAPSRGQDGK
jgi:hypothetical protein